MHLLGKDGEGLTGHDLFLKRLGASFHSFVEEVESATRARCPPPPPLSIFTLPDLTSPSTAQPSLFVLAHHLWVLWSAS